MRKICLALILLCLALIIHQRTLAQCGTVTLSSQAEIDNFAVNHPGCHILDTLIIDGTNASPAITNLNALLHVITEVHGDLMILNTSVTELSPLNDVSKIYGRLIVRNNPNLTLLGLFNLDSLG